METTAPNFLQNSLINPAKSKEDYPQKTKGMSFFAFVFSIFFYISIFYIFNVSPSKLFSNTKFWFFICNTLIIIILVDYGAFSSSSKQKLQQDLYQEYIMRRRSAPIYNKSYSEIVRTCTTPQEEFKEFQNKTKITRQRIKLPDKPQAVLSESSEPKKPVNTNPQGKKAENRCTFDVEDKRLDSAVDIIEGHERKKVMTKTLVRSKSDTTKRVVIDETKNIVRRVETERYDSLPENIDDEEENNEYAKLSDEELNRRVEEFIQRFNRQIRLQRDAY